MLITAVATPAFPVDYCPRLPSLSDISSSVTNFFFSHYPTLESTGAFWQTRAIVPMMNFISEIPSYFIGSMWGGLFLANSASLYFNWTKYQELKQITPRSNSVEYNINKIWFKGARDLVNLSGSAAHFTEWTHQAKWIDIGAFAPMLKSLGYGASLVGAGIDIASRAFDLSSINGRLSQNNSEIKKEKIKEHQRLCWLDIAASVSTVAWSALGLVGLVVSSPVISALFGIALCVSLPLFIISFCYKRHLELNHPKEASLCCDVYL